jgi:hypothetical protein
MNCYFCLNGIDHNINNNNKLLGLKGASAITSTNQKSISIPSNEVDLIKNVLNIAGFYVTRNPQQFQQPEEILRKLTEAWNIISTTTTKQENNNINNSSLKGASNKNICPNKKKEHFKELLNMFHL